MCFIIVNMEATRGSAYMMVRHGTYLYVVAVQVNFRELECTFKVYEDVFPFK